MIYAVTGAPSSLVGADAAKSRLLADQAGFCARGDNLSRFADRLSMANRVWLFTRPEFS